MFFLSLSQPGARALLPIMRINPLMPRDAQLAILPLKANVASVRVSRVGPASSTRSRRERAASKPASGPHRFDLSTPSLSHLVMLRGLRGRR